MRNLVVRVMTWNIHGGVGLDGVQDMRRVADEIAQVDPDILALQEVANRRAEDTLLSILAARTSYSAFPAVTMTAPDGDYGQLVLSRWPVKESVAHDISVAPYEPRRMISLMVDSPMGDVHVLATHLGLRFSERRAQAAILCEAARAVSTPLVALGDFNDWLRLRSISGMLDHIFPRRTHLRTFPARLPLLSLDRIYCSGSFQISNASAPWTLASDHRAVVAELQLQTP